MSISFKEFLREQAAKEEATVQTAQAEIDDWRSSIDRLYDQIRIWLADSDPSGIIHVERREHEVIEEGLGAYRVPRLDLRAFGKSVAIIPKAIHTIGTARPPQPCGVPQRATGRIDITNEIRRHIIYRFRDEVGSDIWMINDYPGQLRDQPLTQEKFEAALMSYFR